MAAGAAPRTRYAKAADGVNIAYRVYGDGPMDLVVSAGFVSNVELQWEEPKWAAYLRRLASFSRLITFDKRGVGLSDREVGQPTLEQRMDDLRAVMDAAGSSRAAVLGESEGGPMAMLFAATYPDRVTALVLFGSMARLVRTDDYPWGVPPGQYEQFVAALEEVWGDDTVPEMFAPSRIGDAEFASFMARYNRQAASPRAVTALARMNVGIDVRALLPALHVPTLVLHRRDDHIVRVGNGRYLAQQIPGAKYVELEGADHLAFVGDGDAVADEIEEFLTGVRPVADPDRVLATVVFTDLVESTSRAAAMGDRAWRQVLDDHHRIVRQQLGRFRGREVKTTGDGFLAVFDGPARAVRCALAARDAVRPLGLELRAGVHTGEVEVLGEDVGGVAVHIGARVAGAAPDGEVLVSRTVVDLVAGSGLRFEDRGEQRLKGVPGEWRLFAAAG